MTGNAMRFAIFASTLLLAACATTPQPEPAAPLPTPITPSRHVHSSILGMTAAELVAHFGNPALQLREGAGLKVQFRSPHCVLDAYLYAPPTGGVSRVTHSDARLQSGADIDQATCISAVEATK
jgi:hypothetical protein